MGTRENLEAGINELNNCSKSLSFLLEDGVLDKFKNVWAKEKAVESLCADYYADYSRQLSLITSIASRIKSNIPSWSNRSFCSSDMSALCTLLFCRHDLNQIYSVFNKVDVEKLRGALRSRCKQYYDNRISGNPVREFSLNLKAVPPSVNERMGGDGNTVASCSLMVLFSLVGMALPFLPIVPHPWSLDQLNFGLVASALVFGGICGIVGTFIFNFLAYAVGLLVDRIKKLKRKKIEQENAKEIVRWEYEVNNYFNRNAFDLSFLMKESKNITSKIADVWHDLDKYIDDTFYFVPGCYRKDVAAISDFRNYASQGRAKTMQEAINLYVAEKKEKEYRAQQEKMHDDLMRQVNEMKRERSAVLNEIYKQVKKNNEIEEERNKKLEEIKKEIDKWS